jgi:hypothetical protein
MSSFASLLAAELRARELQEGGFVIEAHSQRDKGGIISVRVLRFMDATGQTTDLMNAAGAWSVVSDDSET